MDTIVDNVPKPGIDFFSHENLIDPYPTFARMRSEYPVCRMENGLIALTRYADIKMALSTYEIFNNGSASDARGDWLPEDCRREIFLIPKSPPDHEKYRSLVNRRFIMSAIREFEPFMQQKAAQLLDGIPRNETVDFLAAFANPYASTIVCLAIGMNAELYAQYGEDIREWVLLSECNTPDSPEEHQRQLIAATRKLNRIYDEIFAEREHNPRDDLASILMGAIVDGQPLRSQEVRGAFDLLLAAGLISTPQFIANVLQELAHRPALRKRLAEDRSLVPQFVEEALRYNSPTQGIMRTTAQPITLHDVTIPVGSIIQLVLISGNHDEREFDRADELNIDRPNKKHLSFGHGVHVCLGAVLVRLQVKIAVEAILDRFTDMHCPPKNELPWASSLFTRAVATLPATFG